MRPGQTSVAAEYEGVHTKESLGVTVTQGIDADEIRVVPAPLVLLRNETVGLGIVGYKAGKSIGDITGMANVTWQSDSPQTARVEGHSLTGVKPGVANITANLGSLASPPAKVSVVDSIAVPAANRAQGHPIAGGPNRAGRQRPGRPPRRGRHACGHGRERHVPGHFLAAGLRPLCPRNAKPGRRCPGPVRGGS